MLSAGQWRDVLVMTYSEFGRRAGENASRGTDHGTAAAHLLLGGRVKGGALREIARSGTPGKGRPGVQHRLPAHVCERGSGMVRPPSDGQVLRAAGLYCLRNVAGADCDQEESMGEDYEPIACGAYDGLEVMAMHRGICQDRSRLFDHAARHFSSLLRSGFNATGPTGSQFRVWPDHRAGLAAFACS